MELYESKEMCCGCSACHDVCIHHAITMVMDKEGFYYPKIDKKSCVDCERCKKVCPLRETKTYLTENIYLGVQAIQADRRLSGSSGGVFPVLAEYVLSKEGAVFGAAFDSTMMLVHKCAETLTEVEALKKTKYVQSAMKGIFKLVQQKLDEDRWVLFIGTPCQTEAVRKFLNRDYPKLLLVDLICYGVPSPGIWNDYVQYMERKYKGRISVFSFRDKRNRDNGHTVSWRIDDREYTQSISRNLFCMMYFKNLILRPSCHKCRFCTVYRRSDFTIGDFWGIEKVKKEMDDGMGTSLLILHTEKSKKIWEEIRGRFRSFECSKTDILQPRLISATVPSKKRELFQKIYRLLPFRLLLFGFRERNRIRRFWND